jgi:hypothetical protein
MGVDVPLNLSGEKPMQIEFYRWLLVIGFLFGAASGSQAIEYTFITIEVDFPSFMMIFSAALPQVLMTLA